MAAIWNKILEPADLEFDIESANNPIQLNDNLFAYIRVKSSKKRINFNQLSTGIRNFMFKIGHLYALFFNRSISRSFILFDEPENSLFPDFLFELVDTLDQVIENQQSHDNVQFFFATHNPIVAAQFEPYSRIILEWNDSGFVKAFRGVSPAGDDPNDILVNDFKLDHLMGKKGEEMWQEYLKLINKLRSVTEPGQKNHLTDRISEIGRKYNFEI